jgi:hypothetical protein
MTFSMAKILSLKHVLKSNLSVERFLAYIKLLQKYKVWCPPYEEH